MNEILKQEPIDSRETGHTQFTAATMELEVHTIAPQYWSQCFEVSHVGNASKALDSLELKVSVETGGTPFGGQEEVEQQNDWEEEREHNRDQGRDEERRLAVLKKNEEADVSVEVSSREYSCYQLPED